MDKRPIHAPSGKPHQAGYTACGKVMRAHVKTTTIAHHITCPDCARIKATDDKES